MSISARKLQRAVQVPQPTTVYRFTYEAGEVGDTVNAALFAAGDRPWDAVGIGAGSSLTIDDTHAGHGSQAAKLVPAATSTAQRWNSPPSLMGAFRYYVWWDANPSANTDVLWFGSDSTSRVCSLTISTSGSLRTYIAGSVGSVFSSV